MICFYIIIPYLYAEIFDIKYDFSTINKTNITLTFQNNIDEIALKAKIATAKQKIILIWEQKNNSNTYYNFYYYNDNIFKNSVTLYNCEINDQLMEIYFYNNFFYFFCKYKLEKNKYQAFKLYKNNSNFGTGNTNPIIYNGYIYFEYISWFKAKFNEEFNNL